jgi:hypothetical protein
MIEAPHPLHTHSRSTSYIGIQRPSASIVGVGYGATWLGVSQELKGLAPGFF